MIERLSKILSHKNILLYGVISVIILSFKYYLLPLDGDEIKYYELAQNIKYKGQYFYQDYPNTFIPSIPFLIVLLDIPAYPLLGIFLSRLFVFAMLLVGIYYAKKVFELSLMDQPVINAILLGVMFNAQIIHWSVVLYPDIIAFGLLWFILHRILLYHMSENITSQNWLILVLSISILVLVKYVYGVLFLWVVLIWWEKIKTSCNLIGFTKTFKLYKKHNIAIIIGVLPLIIWLQYLMGVDFGTEANESGFSQFNSSGENVLIRNIKKGLGIMPMENGRFNGIPAFINNFIPKNHLRDWLTSVFCLFLVFYGLIFNGIKKPNKINTVLLSTLFLVMSAFILSGTGFSRYWLPLFPIFYFGIRETLRVFFNKDSVFVYFVFISIIFYTLNEIRLFQAVFQSLKS
jgi:hypothetical protein